MRAKSFIINTAVILGVIITLFPSISHAQGGAIGSISSPVINGQGRPIAGATITICDDPGGALPASGTICSPVANSAHCCFTDTTLSTPSSNPTLITNPNGLPGGNSDSQGNWIQYSTSGNYLVSFSGTGLVAKTFRTVSVAVTLAGGVNGNLIKAIGPNTAGDSGIAVNNVPLLNAANLFSVGQSAPSLTDTGLTSGNCVQASGGGLLVTVSGPCGTSTGTLTATGSPVSGNLTKFSGATSVTNADLTGDVTTSGGVGTTLAVSIGGAHILTGSISITGAPPANLYVTTGGSDANLCTIGSPCLTIPRCATVAMSYAFAGQTVTCNLGSGTFQGPSLSGFLNNSGLSPNTQFLILNGNGAANTIVTDTMSHTYVIEPSGGMQLTVQNMNISVPATEAGIFAQLPGTFISIGAGVTITGQASSSIAIHVEDFSAVALFGGNTLTLNGSFAQFLTDGFNGQAGFTGTINCGTATFGTTFALVDGASLANFNNTWSGCGAVTGLPYSVKGNSLILNTSGSALPGNALGIVDSGGRYRPSPQPTIAATTGLGVGGNANINAGAGSHGGTVVLTTGSSGTASSGTVTINWAELQVITGSSALAPCTASPYNGATSWGNNPSAWIVAESTTQLQLAWVNNAGNLATGTTYRLNYGCSGDI
jgi:hypothetical protein